MKARAIIGILVGAVFLVLAFWGVPLDVFFQAFDRLDLRYLLPIALLFFAQETVRAIRQLVFMRPLAPKMRLGSSLSIFFISFLCIHVFPARLGEVVRPYLLARRENVPLSATTGVVVAERAIDALAAALMLVGFLVWVDLPENLVVAGHAFRLDTLTHVAGFMLMPVVLAVLLAVTLFPDRLVKLLQTVLGLISRIPGLRWVNRHDTCVAEAMHAFTVGFHGLRQSGSLALVTGLTILSWGITMCMYWLLAFAFHIETLVGPSESLGVMVITMWAAVLPAPPAMAGVQEAFGRGALALFGVSGPELSGVGLAYAVLIHWGQVLLQALGAWFFLIKDGLNLASLAEVVRLTPCAGVDGHAVDPGVDPSNAGGSPR